MSNKKNTRKRKPEINKVSEEILAEDTIVEEAFYDDEEFMPVAEESKRKRDGIIANCVLLNVRSEPKLDSEPLTVIKEGCRVVIKQDVNEEFYEVEIPSEHDLNGFVMKRFVENEM